MKLITKYWLEAAATDIESISCLLNNDRLTGHVAFHAQQAVEKILKALIEENGDHVPKIHSLSKLFEICSDYFDFQPNEDIIIALDSLYIESRYPSDLGLLPDGKPTFKQAYLFYEFAQIVYQNAIIKLNI